MQYSKKVMEHFKNPKYAGKMKEYSGVGEVGNPNCGDVMEVFIKVKKNKEGKDIIKEISFLTFGCVAAIASSDMLCELAKGKTIEEAEKITNKDIVKSLDGLPPVKVHCSVLGEEALRKAIEDHKKNKK